MTTPNPHRIPIEPLRWDPKDPLAAEYELVSQLIAEAIPGLSQYGDERVLDLTSANKKMMEADLAGTARLVLALVDNLVHYDALAEKVKALAPNEPDHLRWYNAPEYEAVSNPRQIASMGLGVLLRERPKVALGREHLLKMADWMASASDLSASRFFGSDYPLKPFTKAVERFGPVDPEDETLRSSLARVAKNFRAKNSNDIAKLGQRIDEVLRSNARIPTHAAGTTEPAKRLSLRLDSFKPAPVGSPRVFVNLKQILGILPPDDAVSGESPLQTEYVLLNKFLTQVAGTEFREKPVLDSLPAWHEWLALDPDSRGRVPIAAAGQSSDRVLPGGGAEPGFSRARAFDLLLYLSALDHNGWVEMSWLAELVVGQVQVLAAASPLTPGERHVLHRLRCRWIRTAPFGWPSDEVRRISGLLDDDTYFAMVPGEAWSDAVNSDLSAKSEAEKEAWGQLLKFASSATASRPSAKWLKQAGDHLGKVRSEQFSTSLLRWFPLFNSPRTIWVMDSGGDLPTNRDNSIHQDNAICLRGLLWMTPLAASPELARAVGALALSAFRKIPGIGPRAAKLGNAAIYSLSEMQNPAAIGQLALLKVRVKSGPAQKEIEKALTTAAERAGVPRAEIEEMGIPAYGLTAVGVCEEKLGEFTARLTITGTDSTELTWVKADGKSQSAVPAAVKKDFADDLKELKGAARDIQSMLPAQRERLDSLFLQQRTWPFSVWRERYLDHPLVGYLARRLIWDFRRVDQNVTGIWFDDRLVDLDLKPIPDLTETATVQLWHPIGRTMREVAAWRAWFDEQKIQQPFKQAHREVYLLTDAERNTRVYSNRYAAHVIRQHQFNALCAARGWKNQLRLMVDTEYPPASRMLPSWNLRAEFWVEGLGHDFGADTNDAGTFLHLATDQVRFYPIDADQRTAHAGGGGYHSDRRQPADEPLPLADIPPLVFSEVMRDVDLFVGVASVGNDPAWSDGGPNGRHRDYWREFAFGDLSASAKTRLEVLQRLIPRLKIAGQCFFQDKFLIVKGSVRTYKIHLGSGNILMEPNDQYLCIVPKQSAYEEDGVLLPFEGDRTLSVILSKAFLLAADSKIKDPTILSQIKP